MKQFEKTYLIWQKVQPGWECETYGCTSTETQVVDCGDGLMLPLCEKHDGDAEAGIPSTYERKQAALMAALDEIGA